MELIEIEPYLQRKELIKEIRKDINLLEKMLFKIEALKLQEPQAYSIRRKSMLNEEREAIEDSFLELSAQTKEKQKKLEKIEAIIMNMRKK